MLIDFVTLIDERSQSMASAAQPSTAAAGKRKREESLSEEGRGSIPSASVVLAGSSKVGELGSAARKR
jgi:hypothetical protein